MEENIRGGTGVGIQIENYFLTKNMKNNNKKKNQFSKTKMKNVVDKNTNNGDKVKQIHIQK